MSVRAALQNDRYRATAAHSSRPTKPSSYEQLPLELVRNRPYSVLPAQEAGAGWDSSAGAEGGASSV